MVSGIGAAVTALLLVAPACPCRSRPQPIPSPVGPAVPEEIIQEYATQGDRRYQAMQNIQSLSTLDIEAAEKQALSLRMEMKLLSYRDSSVELIRRMSAIIRGAELEEKWKTIYLDALADMLAKVRAMSVK